MPAKRDINFNNKKAYGLKSVTLKDQDATPVGDLLLKDVDQVLRIRDSGDQADKSVAVSSVPDLPASKITSETFDGDRLPAVSITKRGGVPATGTPSGKFLKDDGAWDSPAGAGDMLKSTYDIDNDGVVDDSEKLGGSTKAEVQDHAPKAHTHPGSDISSQVSDSDKVDGQHASEFAASGHTHGQLHDRLHDHSGALDGSPIAVAGVPDLPTSKITSGTFDLARIPTPLTGKDADSVDGVHLPATIASVLSDHNKATHDALAINADLLDALHAADFALIGHNHTLASLSEKSHGSLTDVSADQHHAEIHVLNGAKHTVSDLTPGHFLKALTAGTFGFAAHGLIYTDVGAAASGHNHALADLSEKDHASLTNVLADQHHARSHDHSNALDGSPIAVAGVPNLPASKITSETFDLARIPTPLTGKDADSVDSVHLPATIASVLTDHMKAVHDALAINADLLDSLHAADFALTGHIHSHGALTGLDADDHTQYFNVARHTKAIHDALGINADQVDGHDLDQDVLTTSTPQFAKLGVGIAAQANAVHIYTPNAILNSFLGGISVYASDLNDTNVGGTIRFGGKTSGYPAGYPVAAIKGAFENPSDFRGFLSFATTLSDGTVTEKMRLTAAGYLGINQPSPTDVLDVKGFIKVGGGSGLRFSSGTDVNKWHLQYANSGLEVIETGVAEHHHFADGGKVGIKKINPAYTLDVGGDIHLTGDHVVPVKDAAPSDTPPVGTMRLVRLSANQTRIYVYTADGWQWFHFGGTGLQWWSDGVPYP